VTVADRINAERVVLLGWSRAILLQVSHPLVAAGVARHSRFQAGPLATFHRLHGTIRAMRAIAFGDPVARAGAIAGIRAIHDRVNGQLAQAVGPFAAGTPYSAHDPALLLWVHVTLLESVVQMYETVVSSLTEADRDAYCAASVSAAVEVGARPADVPRTWRTLTGYLATELASDRITVGDDGRAVAAGVLSPPMGWLTGPVAGLNRRMTIGMLPPRLRSEFGFRWTGDDEVRLARDVGRIRLLRARLPGSVAWWPEARLRMRGAADPFGQA
jgi:uncharacterized protein (DUF2236 family)